MTVNNDYRYKKFTTKLLLRDMRFHKSAPKAGEPFLKLKPETTDGNTILKQDFLGHKPLLLIFGSLTCPMIASAMPIIKRLQGKFGDKVEFVLLNVREAHPSEHMPQPETVQTKLEHARKLKQLYDIDRTLHRALDPKPNAAIPMDATGAVNFRSLWASDEEALTQALDNLVSGKSPRITQSQRMLLPVARAMGYLQEIPSSSIMYKTYERACT